MIKTARLPIVALALVLLALSTAQAQTTADVESAAVREPTASGWDRRAGEGAFSLRDPLSGIYLVVGGHAGFGATTRFEDENGCERRRAFFLGCANTPPSDSPGLGGGGSVGIGTRLTPALRAALLATGEAGYHFDDSRWVDRASGERFNEQLSLHSYQLSANTYLDVAGLLEPGALGGFNPYLMTGFGVAFNVTGETRESDTPVGGPTVVNRYPGSTRTSFLWTAGGGVQYRLANGVVADFSYQYVDAGRFLAADGGPQINGFDGSPFTPPFEPIQGHLRTHRLGLAINVELDAIARLFR
ncbi:MAG: hypothetical protein HYR51_10840 [Candidatus Rokubacteria bacterium]|nr:hypothetical protein [Candidatus Rokubacteria bacterium]